MSVSRNLEDRLDASSFRPIAVVSGFSETRAYTARTMTDPALRHRPADAADDESDSRILGRLGRLGARRDGLVHLRPRARARAHRAAAAVRDRGDAGQRRLLRQRAVRAVSHRLGPVDDLGTDGRSLRPRQDTGCSRFSAIRCLPSCAPSPRTCGSSPRSGSSPESASAASGRWAARSSPRSGRRIAGRWAPATCTPATTSGFSSRRSRTTTSARSTAGAGCSWSAARRHCS